MSSCFELKVCDQPAFPFSWATVDDCPPEPPQTPGPPNKPSRSHLLAAVPVLLAVPVMLSFLTIPRQPYHLDDSLAEKTVLNYAHEHRLQFGTDIMFSYGP